jgi:hypothetical protein
MAARQSAQLERVHAELGNGILFSPPVGLAQGPPVERIANQGFEGNVVGWASQGTGATITRSTAQARTGVGSMLAVSPSGTSQGGGVYLPSRTQGGDLGGSLGVSVEPGQVATASAWVMGVAGGESIQIVIREGTADGTFVVERGTNPAILTNSTWTFLTTTQTLMPTTLMLRVKVYTSNTTAMSWYTDDTSLLTPAPPVLLGSVAYGPQRYSYNLKELILDGGLLTKDRDLASVVRALGLFREAAT